MDSKNDDSAGSDSLDKSLQKKCVVDDMGQGEGTAQELGGAVPKKVTVAEPEQEYPCRPENAAKKQKTEKNVGDGGAEGGIDSSIGVDGGGSVAALGEDTKAKAQQSQKEKSSATTKSMNTEDIQQKISHTATSTSSSTVADTGMPTSNTFETKVKQISKDLKETTLAESANKRTLVEESLSSSSSSSELEQVSPSCSSLVSNIQVPEMDASVLSVNESVDEQDSSRSKKVRFHPDVKENDGGNRVIPKKKKKLKVASGGDGVCASTSHQAFGTDDEMELDENEDNEEEEEFDLAKTIAEAQDYLKIHPLTFVRPSDKSAGHLQNGLLEEEDLPQLSESSEEEEDLYEEVPPENGVERILGKQIKCGRVEFLLRYADMPGFFWEHEHIIWKQCPNLLMKYEQDREKRQERLMRHVAKRQNMRQRYTDF